MNRRTFLKAAASSALAASKKTSLSARGQWWTFVDVL
jgi:hypothetical protein